MRDSHHPGELAAGQGTDRTQSCHPPRSAGQEVAPAADRGPRGGESVSRRGVLGDHNHRFARPAASDEDFHLDVPARTSLARVFQLEAGRAVSNDWVVRYANRFFQLARQSHRPPARSTVRVREGADGQIEICYRGRRIQWCEIAGDTGPAKQARTPRAWQSPAPAPAAPSPLGPPRRPSADHPWRRGYDARAIARAASQATARP